MNQYNLEMKLGDGTYGSVIKATKIDTGQVVAIKKFKKKYTSWEECVNLREIKALQKLKHPNIIKLFEVFKEKDQLFLIFEFLDKDIYQQFLENKNNGKLLKEDKIRSIIKQVAEGLAYMHKMGYFHRDLKPENLLVSGDTVKICDFGLAREVRSKPPYTDYVATRWYRAPEILLKQPNYNSPVDIFALGCIMAELYTLNPLFNGSSELDQIFKLCQILGTPNVRDVKIEQIFKWPEVQKLASAANITFPNCQPVPLEKIIGNASPEALDLIKDMLKYDPLKRPSAKQILDYPYFNRNQFNNPQKYLGENDQEQQKIMSSQKQEKNYNYLNQDNNIDPPIINNNKENKNKINDPNMDFMDLIEQQLAEMDKPQKKEISLQKYKESKEYSINSQPKEIIDREFQIQKDYNIPKSTNNEQMDYRIESRNRKQQEQLKFLKHNDPIGEQLRNNQQPLGIQQSKSYEPTKRANLYEFNLYLPPPKNNHFQPKLEMPKPKILANNGQNYPKSLAIGYKFQPQYKFDDIGFSKQPLNKYY